MKEVLKALETKLKKLVGLREIVKKDLDAKQLESKQLLNQINQVKREISNLSNDKTPIISEHAILRYLERVKGLNIKEVENEILTEDVLKLIDTLGPNGTYPVDNFRIVLKNNVITTIVN